MLDWGGVGGKTAATELLRFYCTPLVETFVRVGLYMYIRMSWKTYSGDVEKRLATRAKQLGNAAANLKLSVASVFEPCIEKDRGLAI